MQIGAPEPWQANADEARRAIVATQVRETVAAVRATCSAEQLEPFGELPPKITDSSTRFTLPRFLALIFVNQTRSNKPKSRAPKG